MVDLEDDINDNENDIQSVKTDITNIQTDINQQDDRITVVEENVFDNADDIAG